MNFGFYNVFILKDGELTDLPLSEMLENISVKKSTSRTVLFDENYFSLPKYTHISDTLSTFWIGKFLSDKPFQAALGSDTVEEIAGEAYQPAICLYDESSKMLVVQDTLGGPGRKSIEFFFNEFLEENGHYSIKVIRERSELGLDIITTNTEVLNIDLCIKADDFDVHNFLIQNQNNQNDNLLSALLDNGANLAQEYDVPLISIGLKKGRYKGELNNEIISLVQLINDEDVSLLTGSIVIKLPSGEKKTIDLLHKKYLSHYIDTGELTGYDVLSTILKEAKQNGTLPQEATHYLTSHYAGDYVHCDDRILINDEPIHGVEGNQEAG